MTIFFTMTSFYWQFNATRLLVH